jgi:hypothetical protein
MDVLPKGFYSRVLTQFSGSIQNLKEDKNLFRAKLSVRISARDG